MSSDRPTEIRCAIYTRKSSEEGLEQSFNSLHAQREACEAYIVSQRQEGWQLVRTLYDDGGFSGATMERPALKRLLEDIAASMIDTIVVYKVDRLTRSLADFAKIVEALDKQGVSFVSVTQQFNTTTSMGRLTLNVLLSFAQFEREVTGERIRDKIAASKRKGMWMGGVVPLGYSLEGRRLVLQPEEAETVRQVFRRYLQLRCVSKLQESLEVIGIRSKVRTSKSGMARGGAVFSRGALYLMLQNRIYLGEIPHKGNSYPGQHPAIIDQVTWDAVQAQFAANLQAPRRRPRAAGQSLLTGFLFDREGNRFIPTHSSKGGKRYRYYVSQAASGKLSTTSLLRIPAEEIEDLVLSQLKSLINSLERLLEILNVPSATPSFVKELVRASETFAGQSDGVLRQLLRTITRTVVVSADSIEMRLNRSAIIQALLGERKAAEVSGSTDDVVKLEVSATIARCGGEVRLLLPPGTISGKHRPAPALARAVARAHHWVERILQGDALHQREIAREAGLNERYVSRIISLAFLAPDLTEAILNGTQAPHLSLDSMPGNISIDWNQQRAMLK
jgi:DNA invertase Pin-like site-specific DNA recombinase